MANLEYKSNIWKMYIINFLRSLQLVGGVLVPFYIDWGGITFTQIMILESWFVLWIFLLEIPTGAIADHLGRKASLILSMMFVAIAAFVYSLYANFYVFLLANTIWALGVALMSGADEALVYDSLKKIKSEKLSKKIFGKITSFELMALMIGAPIGGIIASTIGLRYAMMLMAVPFLAGFFVAFSLKEPKIKKKVKSERYMKIVVSGVRYFKEHKILKILAFDRISIAILISFSFWFYQLLLKQLNVPIIYFGFIFAGMSGISIPFINNLEKLEKIFGSKKKYLLWSAIIAGVAIILLGINTYAPIAILLLMVVAGFGISRQVLFQSYMNKHIKSHNRATVISTISMISGFVAAVLYPLIGLLVDWSLNYSIIIVGIAMVIFALMSKVKEEHLID